MKVIRNTEWEPVGYSSNFEPIGGKPVFFFQHRTHEDVIALKEVKYVDVVNNIVFFFNANVKEKVSVSDATKLRVPKSTIHGLLNKCGL